MKPAYRATFGAILILAFGLFTAPVMVHADIFLKPNPTSGKDDDSADEGWFGHFLNLGGFKSKQKSKSKQRDIQSIELYNYQAQDVVANSYTDVPQGEPRTLEELQAKASALKATNLQAAREYREMNKRIASAYMKTYLKRVESNQKAERKKQFRAAYARALEKKKARESKQAAQNRPRIYISPSNRIKKPPKVFTDYR